MMISTKTGYTTEYVADLLREKSEKYNCPDFIPNDPISIPHAYSQRQDIEIMGFWAATLAWGQRLTTINKCRQLGELMDNAPFDFVRNHADQDLRRFLGFRHRTFNEVDTLYFFDFLKRHYSQYDSLEDAFLLGFETSHETVEAGLKGFYRHFSASDNFPDRTAKHVATPARNSACKRLNMFLRWMVRVDVKGVDFGLWKRISPRQLVAPCDVHVIRVARLLGLIKRPQTDWRTALELTISLKKLDAEDPSKFDFALFGLGVERIM